MAATLDQIEKFLLGRRLEYRREDESGRIVAPLQPEPARTLDLVVQLEENGRFIKIFAPRLFFHPDGPYQPLFLQTLLFISWETKMLQWEYDPIDGEVRAMIEFPLEDAILTEAQFFRAFDGLAQILSLCRQRLQKVIETGVDPGREGRDTPTDRLTRDFLDFLRGRLDEGPSLEEAPEEL